MHDNYLFLINNMKLHVTSYVIKYRLSEFEFEFFMLKSQAER